MHLLPHSRWLRVHVAQALAGRRQLSVAQQLGSSLPLLPPLSLPPLSLPPLSLLLIGSMHIPVCTLIVL